MPETIKVSIFLRSVDRGEKKITTIALKEGESINLTDKENGGLATIIKRPASTDNEIEITLWTN